MRPTPVQRGIEIISQKKLLHEDHNITTNFNKYYSVIIYNFQKPTVVFLVC